MGTDLQPVEVEVGETAFDSWLKPLTPGAFNDGIMNICVPTRFMRNWVITHYSDRIHKIWEKKNPAIKSVNFVVQAVQDESKGLYNPSCRSLLKKISSSPAPQNIYQSGLNSVLANSNEFQANTDQSLSVPLNPQYTFDNFCRRQNQRICLCGRPESRRIEKRVVLIRCFCIPASAWAKLI